MPSSIGSPAAPWKVARTAKRGAGTAPSRCDASCSSFFPETRTMPMPALPGAVPTAAITSVSDGPAMLLPGLIVCPLSGGISAFGAGGGLFSPDHAGNLPLLQDRQDIVDEPVENQAGGEKVEHHPKCKRHDHHDLGLNRIGRRGIHLGLNDHGSHHQRWKHVPRIGRRKILDPEVERGVAQFHAFEEHPVERYEYR